MSFVEESEMFYFALPIKLPNGRSGRKSNHIDWHLFTGTAELTDALDFVSFRSKVVG